MIWNEQLKTYLPKEDVPYVKVEHNIQQAIYNDIESFYNKTFIVAGSYYGHVESFLFFKGANLVSTFNPLHLPIDLHNEYRNRSVYQEWNLYEVALHDMDVRNDKIRKAIASKDITDLQLRSRMLAPYIEKINLFDRKFATLEGFRFHDKRYWRCCTVDILPPFLLFDMVGYFPNYILALYEGAFTLLWTGDFPQQVMEHNITLYIRTTRKEVEYNRIRYTRSKQYLAFKDYISFLTPTIIKLSPNKESRNAYLLRQ